MRVIAGSLRSRTLVAPRGLSTRPTSDRLRETLFNVLAPRIEGARFLDLYAGSGAVGIEALSRGAEQVVFVERAAAAIRILRGNLASLGLTTGFEVHLENAAAFLRKRVGGAGFDVVFLDPPYDAAGEYAAVLGALGGAAVSALGAGAVVIAEHRRKEVLETEYEALERTRVLVQGDAGLSFYSVGSRRVEGLGS
jgi:16S rRNA (guanine(966)-N(2))-methyltransferase RsmD